MRCDGMLICPVCGERLILVEKTLRCSRLHSFDVAREGYVHLLPARKRPPKIQGDTREMLAARRRFLASGLYKPLSEQVNELVAMHLVGHTPADEVPVLLSLFAPRNGEEFGRLLAPGALLIIVIPTSAHLANLRRELGLLGIEADKQQRIEGQLADHLTLHETHTLSYPFTLSGEQLRDLVQMTPTAWHYSAEQWARLETVAAYQTEASFRILVAG